MIKYKTKRSLFALEAGESAFRGFIFNHDQLLKKGVTIKCITILDEAGAIAPSWIAPFRVV
jgi:hypothetical protein